FLCCVSSALGRVLLHWSYGTCSGVRPCLDWRPRCTLTTRRVAGSRVLSDFYRYRFWLTPVASGIGQADGSVASRRHLGGVALGSAGSFDSAPYRSAVRSAGSWYRVPIAARKYRYVLSWWSIGVPYFRLPGGV